MTSIGMITFRVAKAEFTQELDWDKLPLETQKRIARYGAMRFINDRVGGEEMTGDKLDAAIVKLMERIESGDWSDVRQGGGARITPLEAAIRQIVADLLIKSGTPKTKAEEAAKDSMAVIMELAKAKAKAEDRGDVETLFEEFKQKVTAKAEANLKAANEFTL